MTFARHPALMATALSSSLLCTGCAVVSPSPLWEMVKASGATVNAAVTSASPPKAANTVYHVHEPVHRVCIEFNPDTQVPDILPALQIELKARQVESRVFETRSATTMCPYWIRYTAYTQLEVPPLGSDYKPYISQATLTLWNGSDQVLSSSHYDPGGPFGVGKWATTRAKLAPVVAALISGEDSKE